MYQHLTPVPRVRTPDLITGARRRRKQVSKLLPIIFINCDKVPFVDAIIGNRKHYETRTRNTLGRFLGEPVLLAETRHGRKPIVKAMATIDQIVSVSTKEHWDEYMDLTGIPVGSSYDWQPDTKVKWLYRLKDVFPVTDPFVPVEGRMHGRVWMEYEGKEVG